MSRSSKSEPGCGQTSVTRYEHTQIGHTIIWSVLAIILIASGFARLSQREIPLVVSIILLFCLVLLYKLSITIDGETVCASFGIGVIRKRVGLAQLVGCEPIRPLVVRLGNSSDFLRLALQ